MPSCTRAAVSERVRPHLPSRTPSVIPEMSTVSTQAQFVRDPMMQIQEALQERHALAADPNPQNTTVGWHGGQRAWREKTHPSLPDLSSARSEPLLMVCRGGKQRCSRVDGHTFFIFFDFWWIKCHFFCFSKKPENELVRGPVLPSRASSYLAK
jgi:hypothetical protein